MTNQSIKEMKISSFAMANGVAQQKCIETKRSLFGLLTTYTFRPTNSRLKGEMCFFNAASGRQLFHLLCCAKDELNHLAEKMVLVHDNSGGERLDCCYSADRNFAALQLFHYSDFLFSPRTETRYFYGEDARTVLHLILQK